MGLVRSAYSAGKPAYGVGPGNAPAFIERTADVPKAVADIIRGKTFDNGVLCSSENSVVVDAPVAASVREAFVKQGGYFLAPREAEAVAKVLVTPQRLPNPTLVGRSAATVAEKAGITVPPGTRVLLAELAGVGRDHPLSIEKLCPVLSYYVVRDWQEGCERCKEILRYGGMGHTMSIHSTNEDVILQFGLHKPAFRIVVNTPTTLGSIGLTTGLDPAMTLGCGGFGGNITSDNISPLHLLNVKRLAYEVRPVSSSSPHDAKPKAAAPPRQLDADTLRQRIDAFLTMRGYAPPAPPPAGGDTRSGPAEPVSAASPPTSPPSSQVSSSPGAPEAFVCEDDVRRAVRDGRQLLVGARTIVTPAARDVASSHPVFVHVD